MVYDYDNAPTDPTHGGKLTAEMAAQRIAELEAALREIREDILEDYPATAVKRIDKVLKEEPRHSRRG